LPGRGYFTKIKTISKEKKGSSKEFVGWISNGDENYVQHVLLDTAL